MLAARYRPRTDRRRGAAFVLAVLAHLLIVWLLLRLGPSEVTRPAPPRRPATFTMLPDAEQQAPKPASRPRAPTHAATRRASAAAPTPSRARPPVPPPPPVPSRLPAQPTAPAPPSLFGDKSLFGAGDIAALSHGDAGAGNDTSKDSAAVYGPGEGSGGQQLFNAEWYREPTDAELATYLPPNLPLGSWGTIACQTVARYHVENCRSIGEQPLGSGLGRALRLASWQFLVLPPRKNGKAMIGAWVRIRIDLTRIKQAGR